MYIERLAGQRLLALMRQFPAVAVLGPRQVGKTTLVRTLLPQAEFFDLEKPSDAQRLEGDPEFTLGTAKPPVVLDEAQRMPQLFSVLRALIDEKRHRRGRFIILGSAHPGLVRGVSESLAGRIGFVDLDPFCSVELKNTRVTLSELWLRGGFPEPCLHPRRRSRVDWMDGYIRTFLERDLATMAVDLSTAQIRRFWNMMAYAHGGLWNASALGSSLNLSYHTVERYADILEHGFLLRRLQPYFVNIGKRLVKRPKMYFTDTGLLHAFLRIETLRQLDVAPQRGASWEAFVIEQIVRRERLQNPSSEFYFYATASGHEIDLLVVRGREKIGIEIKAGSRIERRSWTILRDSMDELNLARAYVVNQAPKGYEASPRLHVVPAAQLLGADAWNL